MYVIQWPRDNMEREAKFTPRVSSAAGDAGRGDSFFYYFNSQQRKKAPLVLPRLNNVFVIMENLLEDRDTVTTEIKHTILEVADKHGVKVDRIILFGSRVSGEAGKYSDWDVLITTEEKLERDAFWVFYIKVVRKLREGNIKVDLIIIDRGTFERKKDVVNTIANEASVEGVTL
jgi:predicted nucleotidyltransferase